MSGSAWGEFQELRERTGWTILDIVSNKAKPDQEQAYAAGFLEGALTQLLIWDNFRNFANGTAFPMPQKLNDFILAQDKWVRSNAQNPSENVDYWKQVGLVLKQLDGLFDGYTQYASASQQIPYVQFLALQLNWELGDISTAIGIAKNGKSLKTGPEMVDSHCSVLVKLSDDGKSLFASHVTWTSFQAMLRTYKNYNLPFSLNSNKAPGVSFSSYPGTLASGDDWYVTSSNLAIMETTNEVMNKSLFQYVTTRTVPYWIRTIVANRMADNGKDWSNIFALYNSGTYSNQWIIVDYKRFVPGHPIAPDTLWIAEQIPGYVIMGDQSSFLSQTQHWPSYNIPFYPFVFNISGYPEYVLKYGNDWSYSKCARAQIFARDYKAVQTMEDMKRIMRFNHWQTDPLSLGDACKSISARCDLNLPNNPNTLNGWSAFGAIDAKITSNYLSPQQMSVTVSGPTWDSQPVFAWNDEWKYVPHHGMPRVFAFDWFNINPL